MKILIVEDDLATGTMLTTALSEHHYIVNLATDGEMGRKLAEAYEYDLILLDVVIPKLDGISLCQELRAQGFQNPILLLTGQDSSTEQVIGLDAGADDYVVKPFDMGALLARIRALLRRGKVSSSTITWEQLNLDTKRCEVIFNYQPLHLTSKEYCLLELFLSNPKRIFSRRAILDRLWDFAESPGEQTVSTHIKCLRQKLKAAGSSDPIETVHGLGYRLRSPAEHESSPTIPPIDPAESADRHQKARAATYQIWEKFKDTYMAQAEMLQQFANDLALGQTSVDDWKDAKHAAHKLAGSLGVFGMMDGSALARQIETLLKSQSELSGSQIEHLRTLTHSLHQELQGAAVAQPSSFKDGKDGSRSALILIIDDDLLLAERIRIEAIAWEFRVEIATDLDVARKMIAQSPPDGVLLDLNFPSSTESGLTLLHELSQQFPTIPVVILTGRESLADRVKVARLGARAFLKKPLPIYEILKTVSGILNRFRSVSTNRVMVVDDDDATLARLSAFLESSDIRVKTLSNPTKFWDVLERAKPDLLVLDFEMPDFNGIELCQVVRNDPRWHMLPILFFSTHTDETAIAEAFAAGADDYISKSTEIGDFVDHIIHRLQRGRNHMLTGTSANL
ncbi:MAG: response regulator [Elainellaceae cyanobacterium]